MIFFPAATHHKKNDKRTFTILLIALFFSIVSAPLNARPKKRATQSKTHYLQTCTTPYRRYTPQSYTHEYRYTAEQLAAAYKESLKNQHESFLIGASTSEHQCSKLCTPNICDWSRFAHTHGLKQPTIEEYPADLWHHYKTYIPQLREKVGINALRVSIEWPLVQPEGPQGFDLEVLQHYAELIGCLIEHGITPIVCFHHYTSPCWFADAGGFEKKQNNAHFAHYCAHTYSYIVNHLASQPNIYNAWMQLEQQNRGILWATFNSPEGVAFKGYRQQEGPPSSDDKKSLYWVSRVLKNMMESHVQAYQRIKASCTKDSRIPTPKIGFLKNITQFDVAPGLSLIARHMTQLACAVANDLNNECIFRFFTKGVFYCKTPLTARPHRNKYAPRALDWIGLNYYSHQQMRYFGRVVAQPDDPNYTDNTNYRIYPHGLFRALAELHDRLPGIPLYVTENGIATQDTEKRNRFYKEYLHELLRAIEHNIPVHGYLTWTAFDNYEWPKTQHSHALQSDNRVYGITQVSADGLTLTLKPGSRYFKEFATSFLLA